MKDILERLVSGELDVDEAEKLLKANNILEFDDIAKFDIKRTERTGFPEAVFSPSKDYEDLITIIRSYLEKSSQNLIITKLSHERYERITSDINIAEEARVIVEEGGCEAITSYDIGVAGIHRLFPQIAYMVGEGVRAFIVCAGMEGALPSVVAGLVDVPVIAVPTSVGYGVGEGGRVALDAMLQSCAPGIAVVNIDNGFGAGVFALTIVNSD